MAKEACEDCIGRRKYDKLMGEHGVDIINLKEREKETRDTIDKLKDNTKSDMNIIWDAVNLKCSRAAFTILLTTLITIFLFLFASELTLHQRISNVAAKITVIEKAITKK